MPISDITPFQLLMISKQPGVERLQAACGENSGWQVETASSAWEAMERLESGSAPQLLLLDLAEDDGDSFHALRWLRRLSPEQAVVAICDAGDVVARQEAMRLGADRIVSRPLDPTQVRSLMRSYGGGAEVAPAQIGEGVVSTMGLPGGQVEQIEPDGFFVAASPAMQKLRAQAELLAQCDVPVLLVGEQGTGKAALARLMHKLSWRRGMRLVKIHCAALPERELEDLLFARGLAWGAGASGAEAGTLLLEEVAALPAAIQARLMDVLSQVESVKNPSGESCPAVRLLSASSEDLDQALRQNRLREDLYHRLSAFTLQVPAVRQRREEIPLLLRCAMRKLAGHYGLAEREFSPVALAACQSHHWAGNLTELESFVKSYLAGGEAAVAGWSARTVSARTATVRTVTARTFAEGGHSNGEGREVSPGGQPAGSDGCAIAVHGVNGAGDIALAPRTNNFAAVMGSGTVPKIALGTGPGDGQSALQPSLKSLIQDIKCEAERKAIGAALERTGWNRKAASRLLRVSYRTLLYKIEQYHMKAAEPYFSSVSVPAGVFLPESGKGDGKAS